MERLFLRKNKLQTIYSKFHAMSIVCKLGRFDNEFY